MATITIPDDVMAGLEAEASRTNDTPERLAAELLRARLHLAGVVADSPRRGGPESVIPTDMGNGATPPRPGVNGTDRPPHPNPKAGSPEAERASLDTRVRELERGLQEANEAARRAEAELRDLQAVAMIPAPFDLKLPGPGERVEVRDGGPLKVGFWGDEGREAE
jgi:hypothetical protein